MTMTEKKAQEDVQKQLEAQQKTIEEYTNTLKRLQADFENYIKRVEKSKEESTIYANHKLITKLLTIVDDFDKAVQVAREQNNEFVNGIEMIYKQFHKILQDEGVSHITALGNKLDPFKHEVVDVVNGKSDDVIVEELQKGYMFKDKVLRPSRVRISKSGGIKI